MSTLCATIDVEDFYDGMAALGVVVPRLRAGDGMWSLLERLAQVPSGPKLTLFVVGDQATSVADGLRAFAEAGHEIASHGADHGRLPAGDVVPWLRKGREMVEDVVQRPVLGFRSPRFDVPEAGLRAYREALAEAGYRYVSDSSFLGDASPVAELPVLEWRRLRVGGGSYQRLLPAAVVDRAVRGAAVPAVVYYHSYDFDGSVPPLGAIRSVALAKQLVGRQRVRHRFHRLLRQFGSRTCGDVAG